MQFTASHDDFRSTASIRTSVTVPWSARRLGITVADRRFAPEANRRYLETKVLSTCHTIDLQMPLLAA